MTRPLTDQQRLLTKAWCHCWGVVWIVAWEVGTPCTRCGCTWISEATYRRRLEALKPRRKDAAAQPLRPMHQRPVATVATGGAL